MFFVYWFLENFINFLIIYFKKYKNFHGDSSQRQPIVSRREYEIQEKVEKDNLGVAI